MSRQLIIAGNWKMNTTLQEAEALVNAIVKEIDDNDKVIKIIIPPFTFIQSVATILNVKTSFFVGAQNCHPQQSGAYTGEISAQMLQSVGCNYCLVGHSERRLYSKETNNDFILKIKSCLINHIKPIFCIGEVLFERKANTHFEVVTTQLTEVLKSFTAHEFKQIILAYEPVWAIGTGETATPEQAQTMHAHIRKTIVTLYSTLIANDTTILYGGSCNAKNANQLFACPDVDGGLIGGAALKAEDFCNIVKER